MSDPVVHVIEDDGAMRESLAFLLDASGILARTWDSAASFLDQFDAAEAGVIVTDVRMPGLSGLDLVLAAYDETAPLQDGWRDRVAVHQLWPLLVHAVLFGGSYGARAGAAARTVL